MCRKLGKGHPDYICRKDGQYTKGEDGTCRMRRMHNGKRVDKHHGANVLNAYTDLRDKILSWVPKRPDDETVVMKMSKRKARALKNIDRHTSHGMNRAWPARRSHLYRNNVCVVSYLRDNQ